MSELAFLTKIPEVKSAVVGDLAGGFLDALRERDGETVAAVMGFLSSTLTHAGDQLGLGSLRRISFSSEARACVVAMRGSTTLTVAVEPPKALSAVEKALDGSLNGKG